MLTAGHGLLVPRYLLCLGQQAAADSYIQKRHIGHGDVIFQASSARFESGPVTVGQDDIDGARDDLILKDKTLGAPPSERRRKAAICLKFKRCKLIPTL